jgi:hypothetical protein
MAEAAGSIPDHRVARNVEDLLYQQIIPIECVEALVVGLAPPCYLPSAIEFLDRARTCLAAALDDIDEQIRAANLIRLAAACLDRQMYDPRVYLIGEVAA